MQASDELNNDVDQVLESLTATLNDNVLAEIETATRKQLIILCGMNFVMLVSQHPKFFM